MLMQSIFHYHREKDKSTALLQASKDNLITLVWEEEGEIGVFSVDQ